MGGKRSQWQPCMTRSYLCFPRPKCPLASRVCFELFCTSEIFYWYKWWFYWHRWWFGGWEIGIGSWHALQLSDILLLLSLKYALPSQLPTPNHSQSSSQSPFLLTNLFWQSSLHQSWSIQWLCRFHDVGRKCAVENLEIHHKKCWLGLCC